MGTTLGLSGAYILAGAIVRHLDDPEKAFHTYEQALKPSVNRVHGEGSPGKTLYLMNPETAWGIWIMHAILGFVHWTGLATLMFKYFGPMAHAVPLEDYGFKQASEWRE
jgi:2-polyprenyl-6-methoxyphenol hydroxylase-like FAD-dependent oxidoreductase